MASPDTSTGIKLRTTAAGTPTGPAFPGSNASTTSFRVRPLVNLTSYTLEVRALRGLEEGQASSTSATTPDGPAAVPKEPRNMSARQIDQGPHGIVGSPRRRGRTRSRNFVPGPPPGDWDPIVAERVGHGRRLLHHDHHRTEKPASL